MWLTPFIDRARHVLDLLSNACVLASIMCALALPHDKIPVVCLQIAAISFKLAGSCKSFYKRVLNFSATRRATRDARRQSIARLSLAGVESWGDDKPGSTGGTRFSVVNPLAAQQAAAGGSQRLEGGSGDDHPDLSGASPLMHPTGSVPGSNAELEGSTPELEAELADWSRAMRAFSDNADEREGPRLSVTLGDAAGGMLLWESGGNADNENAGAMFDTGGQRERAVTETMNPLFALMSDGTAALSGGGLRPTWGHAVRLLLALSVSVGRKVRHNANISC